MSDNPFRALPSVAKVLASPALAPAHESHPAAAVTAQVRAALDRLRNRLKAGEPPSADVDTIAREALSALDAQSRPLLRSVINATGIVLHTNLGRSPLHEDAARAAYEAARGYLNLELDLATGKRSSRQSPIRAGLKAVTGAESATAVNNCAAATVIALRAIAAGKEVVVSRGQLVEIGGSFRIPDVMAVSGAALREVGTTNITRLSDYERAITPNTAALMKVHCSNYRVRGYTKAVELKDLVALGRKHNLLVIDDAGSGQIADLTPFGLPGEPLIPASVSAGADLVLFSGDKLLGGPQCGLIVGKADLIQRIEKDPLMRAFRLDKMTLAALEATLLLHRDAKKAVRDIPTLRMLITPLAELKRRTESFAEWVREIPGVTLGVWEDEAFVGGGSLPDVSVPTVVLGLTAAGLSESELAARLRTGTPAVMARVQDGRVLLDLRCVLERQEAELLGALTTACAEHPPS
ncbi:L-seryl-tRNA(Sec) selenium transferase [Gemmata sp. JC717]|uniref:L-seryl-tRNA(Sec) selenium transferase n=1 Tax=Gemmata algarum TaxID=2975278 RepID=UPI0021BA625F|nr:L-seryl-tRNA(Sec) selenium transferase [Gemmata algarum]MDY3556965.1 L-seryl-tRNA(Sec) selenium transferase [Gemmata algarum]